VESVISGKKWAQAFGVWAGAWALVNVLWGTVRALMQIAKAPLYLDYYVSSWAPVLSAFAIMICIIKAWRGFRYWMVGAFLIFELLVNLSGLLLNSIATFYLVPPFLDDKRPFLEAIGAFSAFDESLRHIVVHAFGYALGLLASWLLQRFMTQGRNGKMKRDDASILQTFLRGWFPVFAGLSVSMILVRLLTPLIQLAALMIGVPRDTVTSSALFVFGFAPTPLVVFLLAAMLAGAFSGYAGRTWYPKAPLWRVGALMVLFLLPALLEQAGKLPATMDLASRHALVGPSGEPISVLQANWNDLVPTLAPGLAVIFAFWLTARLSRRPDPEIA